MCTFSGGYFRGQDKTFPGVLFHIAIIFEQ